jgi:hypothetical protein
MIASVGDEFGEPAFGLGDQTDQDREAGTRVSMAAAAIPDEIEYGLLDDGTRARVAEGDPNVGSGLACGAIGRAIRVPGPRWPDA